MPRLLRATHGALLIAALLALAALLPSGSAAAAPRHDVRSTSRIAGLPSDPKGSGYVGLCDQAGHNVVSGNVDTKPFVWKAVASTSPPKAYQGAGQNAVLNAYQPRPDTRAVEWSGMSLTAASFYTNARRPAVQATYLDLSLAEFTKSFPARVNGLYVLRVLWGKRDYGLYSATYPTTTIQVRGSRWYVVSGGTVDCGTSTQAVSQEQLTGVATKQDVTARAPVAGQSTAPSGQPRRISSTPAAGGAAAGGTGTAGVMADAGSSTSAESAAASTSTGHNWVLWTLGALVVVLATALLIVARRRVHVAGLLTSDLSDHDPKD